MSLKLTRRSLFGWVAGLFVMGPAAAATRPRLRDWIPIKAWFDPLPLKGAHYNAVLWDEWDNRCYPGTPFTFENVWKAIENFEVQKTSPPFEVEQSGTPGGLAAH